MTNITVSEQKVNRILRYIETEGGLNTNEFEYILSTLNRLYTKHLIKQVIKNESS